MNTELANSRPRPKLVVERKVSRYDIVSAMLLASILIIGFLTTTLFLIWLTTAFDFSNQKYSVILEPVSPSADENPEGELDDILEPGVEEFPEIDVPQLAMAIESVSAAVSAVRGSLDDRSGMASVSGFGSREGGPGAVGGGVPDYKRWIIQYEADSIDTYADMLGSFNIDIGVVDNAPNKIVRIHDPGGNPSVIQSSREAEKKSLRFMHKKQRMQRWDQTLAARQNVKLDDTFTCQFYPEETRQRILSIEAAALEAAGRKLIDVRNTVLKVESVGDGFEFQVVNFTYR